MTIIEVENRNVEKYAEAMKKLSADKDLRYRYGEAGRRRVNNNFLDKKYKEYIRNCIHQLCY